MDSRQLTARAYDETNKDFRLAARKSTTTHNDLIMNSPPRYIRNKVAARARTAVFSFRLCSRTRGGGTATVVRAVAARRA